ncbi:MAG: adenylate/guanylate cyclase domain-containing protein [Eudoraea sp.]|nr:adenylate/guanylate cyclase domain-containing protein [Eudoraea sp.]
MKKDLQKRSACYTTSFGIAPSFKAGLHLGLVTAGEIGALKKEIIFSGDVLNTAARIQGLCNQYEVDLLVSEDVVRSLHLEDGFRVSSLGNNKLKGKESKLELFTIEA